MPFAPTSRLWALCQQSKRGLYRSIVVVVNPKRACLHVNYDDFAHVGVCLDLRADTLTIEFFTMSLACFAA